MNRIQLSICIALGFPSLVQAWEPGSVPQSPNRMAAAGFEVDNFDRNDVVAFWHAVYQASEGYETRIKWTGNYQGNSGVTSPEFVDDVERRLNYFRAMSGLHSYATMNSGSKVVIDSLDAFKPAANTSKSVAAQEAALLLVMNYNASTGSNPALTHYPPRGLSGWSFASWNALSKANFAFGLYGPGAITEYLVEKGSTGSATSSWNSQVGHRRWCLYPRATDFATGDQPGESANRPPSNILYVIPHPSEIDNVSDSGFVAYPPAGFFPAELNSPFWSLGREGADFSSATVKMTDSSGSPVSITRINVQPGYGDPAIVWQVAGSALVNSVFNDTRFNVQISGISGDSLPSSYSYSVTLINPDRILSSQKLTGPSKVATKKSSSYSLTPPTKAEALAVVVYKLQSSSWVENAESRKKTKVIDGTGGNYPLLAKGSSLRGFGSISGKSSFRLTFSTSYDPIKRGVPEQMFELDREIIAKSKARLSFDFRRGYMTRGSVLVVEGSSNGGLTWQTLGSPISGVSDTQFDTKISSADIKLPKSSKPIRIRFRYFTKGGIIYTHEAAPKSPTGIFIDDITVKRGEWLEPTIVNNLPGNAMSFALNPKKVGGKLKKGDKLMLAMRTKLGGKWFPIGPVKAVSITR